MIEAGKRCPTCGPLTMAQRIGICSTCGENHDKVREFYNSLPKSSASIGGGLDLRNQSTLNEFDKDEWMDIARKLKPHLEQFVYDAMWAEFSELKKRKDLQ